MGCLQDGVEALIREEEDGRLLLRDVFLVDEATQLTTQPPLADDIPEAPAHYQPVPVWAEFLGDAVKFKPAYKKVCWAGCFVSL